MHLAVLDRDLDDRRPIASLPAGTRVARIGSGEQKAGIRDALLLRGALVEEQDHAEESDPGRLLRRALMVRVVVDPDRVFALEDQIARLGAQEVVLRPSALS